ncbi:MAG: 2-amino-4-hydroxy-6-hydroxymethyldihydropteridine diphosphokinase [Streptosporangiaceae bacterium]|jgi:dihydroneopterin aldolase/2-amino-4-hydroxy-6-hydroxymethyldihydropteridine diphosphokinase|nr:2-amino-4-hydroxy-6-hydroxymethyldihydropteridine pyrophosphokinase [Actinomycetota bacterium]
MSRDRISLLGLRGFGRHGVFDHERASGQEFVVDAVLWVDTRSAAEADDLSLTVDYGAVAGRLAAIVSGPPVALIETLAQRLAAACLEDQAVREVEITVHKPQAPVGQPVSDIAVTIRRGQPAAGRTVVLALGSNLGDRLASLQRGLEELCGPELTCTAVSPVYETDPVGGPEQGDYLNVVLLASSTLPAPEILARCQAAEAALGRVRSRRWGPRTLDADIVACGEEISDDPVLTLPHPRAHERAFVLAPWLDVAPDARLPGHGPVAALLAATGTSGIRRLAETLTLPRGAGEAVTA